VILANPSQQWLLLDLQRELDKLSNQARFVQMIIDGKLVISKKKKAVLIAELKEKNFKAFPKVANAAKAGELEPAMENEDDSEEEVGTGSNGYEYLLGVST
jgi:DNA topoisomerase II